MNVKLPITAVVLTLNEELTIEGCLDSVIPHFDEVLVLDSGSTDGTASLVAGRKVGFATRVFDDYASQRNHALDSLGKRNGWVFFIDADERFTEDMARELSGWAESGKLDSYTLVRLRRRDFFMERWIPRSAGYPTWFGRLCRAGHTRVERSINEQYCTTGKVGFLQSHLSHYPAMKGIDDWLERHNRYSTLEANYIYSANENLNLADVLSRDPTLRRAALKRVLNRLPGRPFLVFTYLYVVRLGFLEGRSGLYYCLLRSYYELMISAKLWDLRKGRSQPN